MAMTSRKNRTRYHPNRFDAVPVTPVSHGGFQSYPEVVSGIKERMLGPKFNVSVLALVLERADTFRNILTKLPSFTIL
jgi:hypothetical protein